MRPSLIGAAVLAAWTLLAGAPHVARAGDNCGCGQAEPSCGYHRHCCARHSRHCCCRDCGSSRDSGPVGRAAPPPRGPVVETMVMPRMMMPMVAMPMMYGDMGMMAPVRRAAFDDGASRDLSCQGSSSRLDDLEKRVNSLRERVNVLQESMETQTEILHAIKRKLDKMGQD
ncbi:MAG: hypothetical protein U0935_12620 [Pirellulales bacterium]